LQKEWPQKELDGLVAREVGGVKIILPVWHNVGAEQIRAYSPTLADRLATSSTKGLEHVTGELLKAIGKNDGHRPVPPGPASTSGPSDGARYRTPDPGPDLRFDQYGQYENRVLLAISEAERRGGTTTRGGQVEVFEAVALAGLHVNEQWIDDAVQNFDRKGWVTNVSSPIGRPARTILMMTGEGRKEAERLAQFI
jgi:hypothetical protein